MYLKDDEIKIIISALDLQFQEAKDKYNSAKELIRDMCRHSEVENILMGKHCKICGRFIDSRN